MWDNFMKHLQDRVALITGGNRGIGLAISTAMAAEGARVAINGYNPETAAAAANELGGAAFPADVRDGKAVQKMVDDVVAHFGSLDILVANAGVITVNSVLDMSEDEWDLNFDVNAKGVFLCCQAAARVMVRQGHGRIIAMGSSASKTAERYIAHYSASKFAVLGFVQALALELAPYHINVNCVCPVMVETDMMELLAKEYTRVMGGSADQHRRSFHQEIPWGRMARPEDVAKAVVFLASDEAEYITGQGLNISGGLEFH
jgi:NAD(P)-dependent dehydrogenase (short-subunit alcohol dehydrogenase family)